MFTLFEIILLAFVGFLFVYLLTDRICRCIEKRIAFKVIGDLSEKNALEDLTNALVKNNIL